MRRLLFGLLVWCALPHQLDAQVRLSEKAVTAQTINGTTITIEYFRPVARGRDTLFGKVVRWNQVWTPGANWATTIETTRDIRLQGQTLPKGKYSIWMIPAQDSAWTFVVNRNAQLYHTRRPRGTADDVLRFKVNPVTASHMEALLWYFPDIQRDSAVLRMHWGTTAVDVSVHTMDPRQAGLTAEQRAMYVGDYYMIYEGQKNDSTLVSFIEEGDNLVFSYTAENPENSYTAIMIPRGQHEFVFGYRQKGAVVDVSDNLWRFVVEGGKATGFEVMDHETGEKVMARARRSR